MLQMQNPRRGVTFEGQASGRAAIQRMPVPGASNAGVSFDTSHFLFMLLLFVSLCTLHLQLHGWLFLGVILWMLFVEGLGHCCARGRREGFRSRWTIFISRSRMPPRSTRLACVIVSLLGWVDFAFILWRVLFWFWCTRQARVKRRRRIQRRTLSKSRRRHGGLKFNCIHSFRRRFRRRICPLHHLFW